MSEQLLQIDFNSDEAIYVQLYNQIVYGIAARYYKNGDSLPSVRALADTIGINMHTVNKTYALLRQDGLLHLDRRSGAVISVDVEHEKGYQDTRKEMNPIIAKGVCKGLCKEDLHKMIDEIMENYE